MNKIETKICLDCGKEIRMVMDNKGEFLRYEKMCPCLKHIMDLRATRPGMTKKESSCLYKRRFEL